MDKENPTRISVPPGVPQPITINGRTYVFNPELRGFTLDRQVYIRPRRAQRVDWVFDEFFEDNFFKSKSEDWYVPGGKE